MKIYVSIIFSEWAPLQISSITLQNASQIVSYGFLLAIYSFCYVYKSINTNFIFTFLGKRINKSIKFHSLYLKSEYIQVFRDNIFFVLLFVLSFLEIYEFSIDKFSLVFYYSKTRERIIQNQTNNKNLLHQITYLKPYFHFWLWINIRIIELILSEHFHILCKQ